MEMNTPPEELKKIVDEAMADPDLKQYPYLLHLLQYPKKNPILFDFMLQQARRPVLPGAVGVASASTRSTCPATWAARSSASSRSRR